MGEISYGKLSFDDKEGMNPKDNPVSYPISYVVPPNKVSKNPTFSDLVCLLQLACDT